MTTKLEQIDLLRKRANVTYEEAADALEKCNNDMVEALIYLERNHKVRAQAGNRSEEGYGIIRAIKNLIKKGNRTKFAISKRGQVVLGIPVTAAVIITLIAPYLTLAGLIIALFTDHRLQFIKENGEDMEVNKVFDKAAVVVNDVKNKLTENVQQSGNI